MNETVTKARLVQILLTVLVLLFGCKGGERQLSIDEVLSANALVPIHYPVPASDYGEMETVYYYSDDSSEVFLVTYFLAEDSEGRVVRVARMSTCRYCGQLVDIDETRGEAPFSIAWAEGGTGACRAHPPSHKDDLFGGEPFQSCLYWLDEDGYQYKLYTVWSEEEAIDFANTLVEVEPAGK